VRQASSGGIMVEKGLGAQRPTTMRVEESIEINRLLEEVFDYVSEVGNFPEWSAHTLEVRKDTAGPPQQGDGFTLAIKSVVRRFETPYESAQKDHLRAMPPRRTSENPIQEKF
jgi:hypothetical protein